LLYRLSSHARNTRTPTRINRSSTSIPRPIAKDLGFERLEDRDEVVEDVFGEAVAMDVFVVAGVREDAVGEIIDVGSCPCRIIIVPTGIENVLPDSHQLVPFGPQQCVIVLAATLSLPGHGN